jgi:uncharacterized protein (DUF1800 family)
MTLTELDRPADVSTAAAPPPLDMATAHRTAHPTAHPTELPAASSVFGLSTLSAVLTACGGGGDDVVASAEAGGIASALSATAGREGENAADLAAPGTAFVGRRPAARFLSQAGFGGTSADIEQVRNLGFDAWLNEQFELSQGITYVNAISDGPDYTVDRGRISVQRALWRKLISSPDVLRQRVTLALTEILVISVGSVTVPQNGLASAAFMDVLESNAFGNYRKLLTQVSTTVAMGNYLTFAGNRKANGQGSQPDENYARELMQLFTIGLFELNMDGTPKTDSTGKPIDSYDQDDVLGMARVFTGWNRTRAGSDTDRAKAPMVQDAKQHELGEKKFLGKTIAAGTNGEDSLTQAVDILMNHPSMAPFISRQLIQRLVASNPSPAYIQRVAMAFKGKTPAENGDMKNTLRAVLLDPEARAAASLTDLNRCKLREPIVRFVQWARTFPLKTSSGPTYYFDDLSSPVLRLGQSPLRAPSVFNFFRPGFVPSIGEFRTSNITAPEFQITTETSVAGYLNFMQGVISNGIRVWKADYGYLEPLADNTDTLLRTLNTLLAAGQVSAGTLAKMKAALDTMSISTTAGRDNRIHAAVMLVMASPEYLVQK